MDLKELVVDGSRLVRSVFSDDLPEPEARLERRVELRGATPTVGVLLDDSRDGKKRSPS
jgi:hypothetical protein